MLITHGHGISDHTKDLELMKWVLNNKFYKEFIGYGYDFYFEKHCKLDGTTPLEDEWSVSFSDLAEVLVK